MAKTWKNLKIPWRGGWRACRSWLEKSIGSLAERQTFSAPTSKDKIYPNRGCIFGNFMYLTVHLKEKNLSTNSSWDFDGVVDTMDPYWFVPDKYFFPRSYLSRWRCNSLQELFKKVVKIKSRQHFQAKKTSATPKFCKWNFSRMLRFGNMNILSTPAPIFRVPKILVRYVWGEKFPSGKNK